MYIRLYKKYTIHTYTYNTNNKKNIRIKGTLNISKYLYNHFIGKKNQNYIIWTTEKLRELKLFFCFFFFVNIFEIKISAFFALFSLFFRRILDILWHQRCWLFSRFFNGFFCWVFCISRLNWFLFFTIVCIKGTIVIRTWIFELFLNLINSINQLTHIFQ